MPSEQFRPIPSPDPEEIPLPPLEGEHERIFRLADIKPERRMGVPPPIPEAAKKRKGPPPIPEAVRKASIEAAQKSMERIQEKDVIDAFEVRGFNGLEVGATMSKKNERLGSPEKRNEDNILIDPETGLTGVLDGLGGEGAEGSGALASKAAELVIPEAYKEAAKEIAGLDNTEVQKRLVEQQLAKVGNPNARMEITERVEQLLLTDPALAKEALALVESIRGANDAVKESGGKTTALISKIHETPDGRRFALIANVGDCAAYKQRADGEIMPITEEDSALNGLRNAGELSEELLEEMKTQPDKVVDIPLSLKLVEAFGGDQNILELLQEVEDKLLNKKPEELTKTEAVRIKAYNKFKQGFNYHDLKKAMVAGLGSQVFEPSLTVRELRPGESVFFATDGQMDVVEDPETGDLDMRQILLDMSGEKMQKFFDPAGNVDMEKLRKKVMALPLKDRLNNMRSAAFKNKKKDDDIAIVGVAAK